MILTISSQNIDLCDSIAVALANRRAEAGRNVLLLCQKMFNMASTSRGDKKSELRSLSAIHASWLATEMKAGAKPRDLPDDQVANELVASSLNPYRDIVIDMPTLDGADVLSVLAASGLVLFVIQVATWNQACQDDLIEKIKAARSRKDSLPILIVIDEQFTSAGQELTALLNAQIPGLNFIALSKISEMSMMELYRIIYMERTLKSLT